MKMMKAATDKINSDKEKAAGIAAEWTKKPLEVERMSVPNIIYTVTPGEAYKTGLYRWFDMMNTLDKFQGTLKGKSKEDAFEMVHDLTLIEEVL